VRFCRAQPFDGEFAGATQVQVISVNKLGETALSFHRAAIEAACAAGARRVLYTSHMSARLDSLRAGTRLRRNRGVPG